ncbi:hypothetical protein COLO4_36813 [Corchorus olitorius]|uniref:Uncharacterized protein n=1 Tax=Corchorus olitorius TaxID=93759 RepID=A0A1R3G550_9ROSI|nr:hypothetical protein COLO4_36813 [Corchorus olitorius]
MGRVYRPNRLPPTQPTLVGSVLRGGSVNFNQSSSNRRVLKTNQPTETDFGRWLAVSSTNRSVVGGWGAVGR